MFKKIIKYFCISIFVSVFSVVVRSDFLSIFLKNNLINLAITLLAINTATSSIILSRLKKVSEENDNYDFSNSYNEIKKALCEQLFLIIIVVFLFVLQDSKYVYECFSSIFVRAEVVHKVSFDVLTTTAFAYMLDIVYDTGVAIFSIIKPISPNKSE